MPIFGISPTTKSDFDGVHQEPYLDFGLVLNMALHLF